MPSDGPFLLHPTLMSINQEFNKSLTYEQMKSDLIEKAEEFADYFFYKRNIIEKITTIKCE